jgi:glutamate N-acetyltransferase/amino-acid N-acetyltransferase
MPLKSPTKRVKKSKAVPGATKMLVPGFTASGISCGIKLTSAPDLALIFSETDAQVAGVFTTSSVKAAPVLIDIPRVRRGTSRGVIVNSGNANACIGKLGLKTARSMVSGVEAALGLKSGEMLVSSTGVIGVPLAIDKILGALPRLVRSLTPGGLKGAARAMMTTDAYEKTAWARARIGGKTVTLGGVAKGAGMICPNMATMLAYILTDANIRHTTLSRALTPAVEKSFNSIVVDNDTSTNDTVLAFANGLSGGREIKAGSKDFRAFAKLLESVCMKLALMIVADGEGATRVIEINVRGASSTVAARKGARAAAESMLVKTAFFGADPNWGRIVAALGKSGIKVVEEKLAITMNGVKVMKNGCDTGNEKRAAKAIKAARVVVTVELNIGKGSARLWTSDLTYDYVKINSAYRT